MIITRSAWVSATAKALSTDASKELFSNLPLMESLFTDCSYDIWTKLCGKDISKLEYGSFLVTYVDELRQNVDLDITASLILSSIMVFAILIWDNLEGNASSEYSSSHYESFKSDVSNKKGK